MPGALFQLNGDKQLFRLAALLELTAGGVPMIYYGEEVGRLGGAPATAGFDVPAEWGATPVRDVWTGEAVAASGGKIMAPVASKGFRIFAIE